VTSKCPKVEDEQLNDKSLGDTYTNDEEKRIDVALVAGEKLSFTNVRFKVDSDELTEPSMKILDNVVTVLNKRKDLKLEIQGHTDSDGAAVYNQDLSERRALSVKNYLVNNGINRDRLTTIGYGETNPVASNTTKEGKAKNRRIEFMPVK
jgi:OOP family OmpA-OmpF porin